MSLYEESESNSSFSSDLEGRSISNLLLNLESSEDFRDVACINKEITSVVSDVVANVMDIILKGPETPTDVSDDFSEENPCYGYSDQKATRCRLSDAEFDNHDFPRSIGSSSQRGNTSDMNALPVKNTEKRNLVENQSKSCIDAQEVNSYLCGNVSCSGPKLKINCGNHTTLEKVDIDADHYDTSVVVPGDTTRRQNDVSLAMPLSYQNISGPAKLIQWRQDQVKMIGERDAAEAERLREWIRAAHLQYEVWMKNYSDLVNKARAENRNANKALLNVKSIETRKIGVTDSSFNKKQSTRRPKSSVWQYVSKLCDLSPKNTKITSDVSRMRLLMLQLKKEKFSVPKVVT